VAGGSRAGLIQSLRVRAATQPPGAFAFVMGTGIVSQDLALFGFRDLSLSLLGLACAGYLWFLLLFLWRVRGFRAAVQADLAAPGRSFTFFTFVAGSEVLASGFAGIGAWVLATVLAFVGLAAWFCLNVAVPIGITLRPRAISPRAADGSWLLWVVATQSLAVAMAALAPAAGRLGGGLLAFGVWLWGLGVVLYLCLIALIVARLLFFPLRPRELRPSYWIAMGATAITTLAAARLLGGPVPAVPPALAGGFIALTFALWAFGSAWIPALALLFAWRHRRGGVPLSYEAELWSMVFPFGMYAVATDLLGRAAAMPWLEGLAHVWSFFAYAAWAAVFLGMVAAQGKPRAMARSASMDDAL